MTAELRPKLIGARVQRLEDPRLLTGNGAYVDDRRLPGILHIAFRRSDHSHARIVDIDAAVAATMPGVVAVVTAADIEAAVRPIRAASRMRGYHATAMPILAGDKVRYVGEPVVAVVAESRYLAEDAVEQIAVTCEPLPHVVDAEAAAEPGAPLLHDEAGSNVIVAREFAAGDIEAVMATAPVRVGGRFRVHRKTGRLCELVRKHNVAAHADHAIPIRSNE